MEEASSEDSRVGKHGTGILPQQHQHYNLTTEQPPLRNLTEEKSHD